jgi:two-component system chemotaxis response regulator CheY
MASGSEKRKNLRILIVEDDESARNVTARFLTKYGRCDTAADGEAAMELFQKSRAQNDTYDVIFLDIMMPRMSGRKVLNRIREIEDNDNVEDRDRTRIIITTSLSDPASISSAFRSRCEGYLVKPFAREDLEKQLQGLDIFASTS